MPLAIQITNIYRNRAIGYCFQKHGVYVIPCVRWGDERTYTTKFLPEEIAFLGVEKHSIEIVETEYGAKYKYRIEKKQIPVRDMRHCGKSVLIRYCLRS